MSEKYSLTSCGLDRATEYALGQQITDCLTFDCMEVRCTPGIENLKHYTAIIIHDFHPSLECN